MRFVYEGGKYREFRGYVFANGKPVTVTDRGTLEAIAKDRTFRQVDDAPEEVAPAATAAQEYDPNACPKCGRVVKQGKFLHIKNCKGK